MEFFMNIENIKPGENPPKQMTAIIEVTEGGRAKYEIDKKTGLLRVDRILHTPLSYPADYGYFPGTHGPCRASGHLWFALQHRKLSRPHRGQSDASCDRESGATAQRL